MANVGYMASEVNNMTIFKEGKVDWEYSGTIGNQHYIFYGEVSLT